MEFLVVIAQTVGNWAFVAAVRAPRRPALDHAGRACRPTKAPRRGNNWDFGEKKKRYFTSKKGMSTFALTSQVLKEAAWTPDVVARR